MAEVKWTPQQLLAIETIDSDVLLTASAGSGKTAVLSERFLYLLTGSEKPCNVDQLLVMTYTEAAVAEMRGRIGRKLSEYLKSHPGDNHIRRQLVLLDKASISTVHAFCRSVLSEFFYKLDISPDFDMLSESDSANIKNRIAGEILQEYFDEMGNYSEDNVFTRFLVNYKKGLSDRSLVHLIIRLHNYLDTLDSHDRWLGSWKNELELICDNVHASQTVKFQKQMLQMGLDRVLDRFDHIRNVVLGDDGLEKYVDYIDSQAVPVLQDLRDALDKKDLPAALKLVRDIPTLAAVGRKKVTTENEMTLDAVKAAVKKAQDDYKATTAAFSCDPADTAGQINSFGPHVNLLLDMHAEFYRRYQQAKRQMNALDFGDLEHKCLDLLLDNDSPSAVAVEVVSRYRHFLIDEYQDISPVQEAIIQTLKRASMQTGHPAYNFMVGDIKQSIYGFRQADPQIFLDKFNSFTPTDKPDSEAEQKRIDLNMNFRSRRHIVDSVNYIFDRCMTHGFSGLDYRADGQLAFGADYYEPCDPVATELHLIEQNFDADDDSENLDKIRREAFIIGKRILKMIGQGQGEFQVYDPEQQGSRDVEFRDIVLLLRSTSTKARIFLEIFRKLGIPAHADLKGGFFESTEIRDMLAYLTILDNPCNDIAIAAVLRGPLMALNESQLTEIRLFSPEEQYYEAIVKYSQDGPDEKLQKMLTDFLKDLNQQRTAVRRGPLSKVIWEIYQKHELLAYVTGLSDGYGRYRNLIYFYDLARQYDAKGHSNDSSSGIMGFLGHIGHTSETSGDLSPAAAITEADNVVKIMSIHKSKGLEFPVVFIANLDTRFNLSDGSGDFLFDRPEFCAIGAKFNDDEDNSVKTVSHNVVATNILQRQLAEEMRIYYVAMTRVRERLILSASTRLDKLRQNWQLWRYQGDRALPDSHLSTVSNALDWIGPAITSHKDCQDFLGPCDRAVRGDSQCHFNIITHDNDALTEMLRGVKLTTGQTDSPADIMKILTDNIPAEMPVGVAELEKRLNWQYPDMVFSQKPARSGVTELKNEIAAPVELTFDNESVSDISIVGDINNARHFKTNNDRSISAADKGTLVHLFMQHLDLNGKLNCDDLTNQLNELVARDIFTEKQAQAINIEAIEHFFKSEIGKLILDNRQYLHREWAFTIAISAGEIWNEIDSKDKHKVIVRGIVDCMIDCPDGAIIIDYKTDNIGIDMVDQRAKDYKPQIQLYAQAVSQILNKKTSKAYLCFLAPAITAEVKLD
ncbi:MAG: helicase-exonuclease AddAB subunit AddA [Phycisphaerae bacterium]|nr:helicase-exonuclease AddAB subunit AddA [Phycisphaerae bacterium]